MYSSCVAHVHGNALTCSISSMVERSPSRTAHMWLTCMVMPSRVAFPQWWRDIHVWDLLTCGGDIHQSEILHSLIFGGSSELPMWLMGCFLVTFFGRWRGAVRIHVSYVWLMCTVMPSRVAFPQWWRGAPHVQLTCGSHAW